MSGSVTLLFINKIANTMLHTVLGANGAIGLATIEELKNRQLPIRAVSRNSQINGVENRSADLLQPDQAEEAIHGSSHVYLCVGLPYKTSIWQRDWEILMQHCIKACEKAKARLIFLDKIYLYGPPPLRVPITEAHLRMPASKKGKARKRTTEMLLRAFEEERIQGVVGRAADIYGPDAINSPFYIAFLERMLQGKAPQSLCRIDQPHTFAYTGDLGRALVALALDERTHQQEWHLPVGPITTVQEMTDLLNEELSTDFQVQVMPKLMRKTLGLFMPIIREVEEMLYQLEDPYVFSFEKFQQHFPEFQVMDYRVGLQKMVRSFQGNNMT